MRQRAMEDRQGAAIAIAILLLYAALTFVEWRFGIAVLLDPYFP